MVFATDWVRAVNITPTDWQTSPQITQPRRHAALWADSTSGRMLIANGILNFAPVAVHEQLSYLLSGTRGSH